MAVHCPTDEWLQWWYNKFIGGNDDLYSTAIPLCGVEEIRWSHIAAEGPKNARLTPEKVTCEECLLLMLASRAEKAEKEQENEEEELSRT